MSHDILLTEHYNELARGLSAATGLIWEFTPRVIFAGEPAVPMLITKFQDIETAPIVEEHINKGLSEAHATWRNIPPDCRKEPLRAGRAFTFAGDHMKGQIVLIPAQAVSEYAEANAEIMSFLPQFTADAP